MRVLVLILALLAACGRTEVDDGVTGFELETQINSASGVTQLAISGWVGAAGGAVAFAPGVVPEQPRELAGRQTAVVLLPDELDGSELLVRVDALAGEDIVHTGGQMITIRGGELRKSAVTLGAPVTCGDGQIDPLFEQCDDVNTAANDGCSATCLAETGWNCVGVPSQCAVSSSKREIMGYAFLAIANPGLKQDVIGSIQGTNITLTVPFGTNIGGLVATFASTGASVRVAGATQVSGQTPNDFTSPVTYTVIADDGSVRTYTVTVTIASSIAKDITAFAFRMSSNNTLTADVVATINGTAIAATVPAGTNLATLVASFSSTSGTVTVNGTPQVSGQTVNNFSAPIDYTVTAADSTQKVYTVTVTVAASSANDLTAFSFRSANNPSLAADITASITGTTITASVPSGTDVSSLVATFATTGAAVTVNGSVQSSGVTPNNFTTPVNYVVTASDTSTKTYQVIVTVAPSTAKAITSFAFASANNPSLAADVVADIVGTQITATVPAGTNVGALVATFATTGTQVRVGGAPQTSGVTPNSFASPVPYVVVAADGSMQTYTVTVTAAASAAKDITSYVFLSSKNPNLPQDVVATISGTSITATVPSGTNVNSLVATFQTTGTLVKIGSTTQNSGVTPNNFSSAKTYTVTAADASTKNYTVTVTVAASSQNEITAFGFQSAKNPGLAMNAVGTINGTTITVVVPAGTNRDGLIATFSTTGNQVRIGSKPQVSGVTANNFTAPITYTVVAANSAAQTYTVNVVFP